MRIKVLPFLLLASATTLGANTVELTGTVAAQTCEIKVNGATDPVVSLPVAETTSLGWNSSTGQTPFNILASNCPQTNRNITLTTSFIGTNVAIVDYNGLGYIRNMGTARNVGLQLTPDSYGAPIDLATPWVAPPQKSVTIPANSTTGNRSYYVRYFSPRGNVSPGTVQGSVQYVVAYP